MRALAVLGFLAACHASAPDKPGPANRASPTASTAPAGAPAVQTRCLPVVAKECGCVYDCGKGESTDGKAWRVTHACWKDIVLDAVIEPWCVDGKCTDVFAAQIMCDGICAGKPADPTCTCKTSP
jgi:hypothetical protein